MDCPADVASLAADWLEGALAAGGRWPAGRITGLEATVIGIGYGLDGTVAHVRLEGVAGDGPSSLVAKFATAANGRREAAFYEQLAPTMPIRLPAFYGHVIDDPADRAVLLLEDLTSARQGDAVRGASYEDGLAVLDAMARYHAAFVREASPAFDALPRWEARVDHLAQRVADRRARYLERLEADLATGVAPLLEAFPDLLAQTLPRLASAPVTLVHTDLHLDNVLFLEDGTPVVLDWTGPRRGPASLDVGRFLVEGARLEGRRRHEEAWLNHYAESRRRAGAPLSDPDAWRARLDAAVLYHLVQAVVWGGAEDPGYARPRVRAIVGSLSRNAAGAVIDRFGRDGT